MTLKVFRDAYLAARFLPAHLDECVTCAKQRIACPEAFAAREACARADRLLDRFKEDS